MPPDSPATVAAVVRFSRSQSRAVAYCVNAKCSRAFVFGTFLTGPTTCIPCCDCNELEHIELETYEYEGGQPYREVRIEYNYDPIHRRYRGLAIVSDDGIPLGGGGVHIVQSPIVKTEKRALAMAELRLANLGMGRNPHGFDVLLRMDEPLANFREQLSVWERTIANSTLAPPPAKEWNAETTALWQCG